MKKDPNLLPETADPRRLAEARVQAQQTIAVALAEAESQRSIHEPQVRQIDLDITTRKRAEEAPRNVLTKYKT